MDQIRLLAWQCRGLGEISMITESEKLCFQQKPSFILLSETKRTVVEMNSIRSNLGFDPCFAVVCVGRRSGLALLWLDDFNLTVSIFPPIPYRC
ncbi:hypothetical protein SLA2020_319960 [Shorea laevis]